MDECALNTSGCNQMCTNTNGHYVCSCYYGYHIILDNETCIGKHTYAHSFERVLELTYLNLEVVSYIVACINTLIALALESALAPQFIVNAVK